jgi:hypothetical protein
VENNKTCEPRPRPTSHMPMTMTYRPACASPVSDTASCQHAAHARALYCARTQHDLRSLLCSPGFVLRGTLRVVRFLRCGVGQRAAECAACFLLADSDYYCRAPARPTLTALRCVTSAASGWCSGAGTLALACFTSAGWSSELRARQGSRARCGCRDLAHSTEVTSGFCLPNA